jgi:hypothetical protein
MTKGVKRDFFFDISLFQGLTHYPVKTFAAVTTIGGLTIKKPDVRFFYSEICFKPFCHIILEKLSHPVFWVGFSATRTVKLIAFGCPDYSFMTPKHYLRNLSPTYRDFAKTTPPRCRLQLTKPPGRQTV